MSNLVFSRRAVQVALDALSQILTREQRTGLVARLNRKGRQRFDAAWEAVFLHALSQVGPLKHAVKLDNGREPDFTLELTGTSLVGDITTVSDQGLREENPVDLLVDEVWRIARRHRLGEQAFYVQVRGARSGRRGRNATKLLVPSRGQMLHFVRENVTPYIVRVASMPDERTDQRFIDDGLDVSISYDPRRQHAGWAHPAYDIPRSLTKNSLFRALKSKSEQMRAAPADVVRVILACDGGSRAFARHGGFAEHGTYGGREIALDFLRQVTKVDLVALVAVEGDHRHAFRLRCDSIRSPQGARTALRPGVVAEAEQTVLAAVRRLPTPIATASNALVQAEAEGIGPDSIGGYVLEQNRLRISARAMQRLLAGSLTPQDFVAAHGWEEDGSMGNPFLMAMKRGEMIRAARIVGRGDEDDDWLEIEFGRDPACGAFV